MRELELEIGRVLTALIGRRLANPQVAHVETEWKSASLAWRYMLYGLLEQVLKIRDQEAPTPIAPLPLDDLNLRRWELYRDILQAGATADHGAALKSLGPLSAGTFQEASVGVTQDVFIYNELVSLHAMFGIAAFKADQQLITQLKPCVVYHVENTQSDYITSAQPFGLAAFATLDETHTFALQQLHDLESWYGSCDRPVSMVSIQLLADALAQLKNVATLI